MLGQVMHVILFGLLDQNFTMAWKAPVWMVKFKLSMVQSVTFFTCIVHSLNHT